MGVLIEELNLFQVCVLLIPLTSIIHPQVNTSQFVSFFLCANLRPELA